MYGVAVVVVCDYRILRVRVKGLDAEEQNFLWERAHRRSGCTPTVLRVACLRSSLHTSFSLDQGAARSCFYALPTP